MNHWKGVNWRSDVLTMMTREVSSDILEPIRCRKQRGGRGMWEDSLHLVISEQFAVDFFVFCNAYWLHVDLILFNQCHLKGAIGLDNECNVRTEKGLLKNDVINFLCVGGCLS